MKKILSFLMMSVIIFTVSCKKDKTPQENGPVAVTGVKIIPESITVKPHTEQVFTVEILPANAPARSNLS